MDMNNFEVPDEINIEQTSEIKQADFIFDLDTDGHKEKIEIPGTNSGLLALDKNGNNIIDNGSELFGPTTGNGFPELSV